MEHIAAFMMLVGCNVGGTDCRELPVPVPAYEDVAECASDLNVQLRLQADAGDRIFGVCKDVDEETFDRSTRVDWSVTADGRLRVRFDGEAQVVAAR